MTDTNCPTCGCSAYCICTERDHMAAAQARIAELERTLLASAEETQRAFNAALSVGLELKDAQAELARVKAESLRVVRNPTGGQKPRPEFVAYLFFEGSHVRLERWETEE